MTIYSLDVLLFQSSTSPLFHVWFELLLLDLHTDFSGGRSGGLVFSSLEDFPVCCDPHCQRLWYIQWSRSRCFSGILLLFLWFSGCCNLISGSSAFFKWNLNIWKFLLHVLLKPSWEDFEHYIARMWNECNCAVVWTFFGIALFWDCTENWPFPALWLLLSFPNLLTYWVQDFHSIIF